MDSFEHFSSVSLSSIRIRNKKRHHLFERTEYTTNYEHIADLPNLMYSTELTDMPNQTYSTEQTSRMMFKESS